MNSNQSKSLFEQITEEIGQLTDEAIIITDTENIIKYVNQAYLDMTGYTYEEVIVKNPGAFKSGRHSNAFYDAMWHDINTHNTWTGIVWDKRKDNVLFLKYLKIKKITLDNETDPSAYVGVFKPLSMGKTNEEVHLYHEEDGGQMLMPTNDVLVSLVTESLVKTDSQIMVIDLLVENYIQLIKLAVKEGLDPIGVFIEKVYQLLDGNGMIIQSAINVLTLIIDFNVFNDTKPEDLIKRLNYELSKTIEVEKVHLLYRTRMGIAIGEKGESDIKQLLVNGMAALDWAAFRDMVEYSIFNDDMIDTLRRENEIEVQLKNAVNRNELKLVYQPQLSINDGSVIGIEALLRWHNEEMGFVSPNVFIPVAEKSSLMIEIGDWVIERVMKDMAYIREKTDILNEAFRCAINISSIQMDESSFTEKLLQTMSTYGIKGEWIELELTERQFLSNVGEVIQILENIRSKGITTAIDDFGTGYSSMAYLKKLPIDLLKVDRSFIKDYPEQDEGTLAKIMIEMSKALGMKVLTEGVETEEQLSYLRTLGCDYVQGYYHSKPLPIADLIDYVHKVNGK